MRRKWIGILSAALLICIVGCGETVEGDVPPVAVTEGIAPTETLAPTGTPMPTETPEPTGTSIPTEAPEPPATPTPLLLPEGSLLREEKTGETVWTRMYGQTDWVPGRTLIVSGTGTLEMGEIYEEYRNGIYSCRPKGSFELEDLLERYYLVSTIIIEEGVTTISKGAFSEFYINLEKVVFPSTLEKIERGAFYKAGVEGTTQWIGLPAGVEIEKDAFKDAKNIPEEYYALLTPTPTPLPDADQPRLCHAVPMGDSIVFEFWDNGYLYVKGSGATRDEEPLFDWTSFLREDGFPLTDEYLDTLQYLVVDEGVTRLGNYVFDGISFPYQERGFKEVWLPSTLTDLELCSASPRMVAGGVIHGYQDGNPVTLTYQQGGDLGMFFEYVNNKKDERERHKISIAWE